MQKIAIGCDPNAVGLKEAIIKHLAELGYECEDYGSDDPVYANVAIDVARTATPCTGTCHRNRPPTTAEPPDRPP